MESELLQRIETKLDKLLEITKANELTDKTPLFSNYLKAIGTTKEQVNHPEAKGMPNMMTLSLAAEFLYERHGKIMSSAKWMAKIRYATRTGKIVSYNEEGQVKKDKRGTRSLLKTSDILKWLKKSLPEINA